MVVVDVRGRVLLFHNWDPSRPGTDGWWITPGGGADGDESLADAAVREVREETGLDVTGLLSGPLWSRSGGFVFDGVTVEQDEQFFLARLDVDGDTVVPDRTGWTALELRSMGEQRWWTRADLAATTDTVFPEGLVDRLTDWLDEPG